MMPGTMSATKINTRTCPGTSGKLRATRCPALTDFASEHVLHEVTHLLECLACEVANPLHSASQCIAHLIHVRRQRVARDARGDSACCRQCDLGTGAGAQGPSMTGMGRPPSAAWCAASSNLEAASSLSCAYMLWGPPSVCSRAAKTPPAGPSPPQAYSGMACQSHECSKRTAQQRHSAQGPAKNPVYGSTSMGAAATYWNQGEPPGQAERMNGGMGG